jgi:integrase
MASLRKRGKTWYYRFVDADGVQRERKGCNDHRETEKMASAAETEATKVRAGLVDPKAVEYRRHEGRPIDEHLDDFGVTLLARGNTVGHVKVTASRALKVLTLGKIRRIRDLSLSKVTNALALLREEGLSAETINHHVRAVKAFSRWLWRDNRAREHYLAHLATSNPEADRRRRRRALTAEEADRLIRAADAGPKFMTLTGPTRARAYSVALATGFRAEELRSLTPERFNLEASPPTFTVPGAYTKNGKEAIQPFRADLAAQLAPWLATLPKGKPIFPMLRRTADMIRFDLLAAGVPYETPEGVVDFHALRVAYVSNIVASGASVKVCQTLARHSTPTLTIGVYAKASHHDIGTAVNALPTMPAVNLPAKAELHQDSFALPLPYSADGTCRDLAVMRTASADPAVGVGMASGFRNVQGTKGNAAGKARFAGSMREEGFEPSRLAAQEPKSCVSASSTTLALSADP